MAGMHTGCRLVALLLFFVMCGSSMASAQVNIIPAVEIDCNNKSPKLNVHPVDHDSVTITCTVRNTSDVEEQIDIEKDLDE